MQKILTVLQNFDSNIDARKPSWQVFADILRGAKVYE